MDVGQVRSITGKLALQTPGRGLEVGDRLAGESERVPGAATAAELGQVAPSQPATLSRLVLGESIHVQKLKELALPATSPVEQVRSLLAGDRGALQALSVLEKSLGAVNGDSSVWKELLRAHESQPLKGSGISSGAALMRQILVHLAEPNKIFQGKNTCTCTATSLQSILAQANPVRYVRLARALCTHGKTNLCDGSEISIQASDLKGAAGRDMVSVALQEAFMRHARGADDSGTEASRFTGKLFKSFRTTFAGQGDGLTASEFNRLFKAVTGQTRAYVRPDPAIKKQLLDEFRGGKGTVTVLLGGGEGSETGHAVVLKNIGGTSSNPMARFYDPAERKMFELPLDQFLARAEFLLLKANKVAKRPELIPQLDRQAT